MTDLPHHISSTDDITNLAASMFHLLEGGWERDPGIITIARWGLGEGPWASSRLQGGGWERDPGHHHDCKVGAGRGTLGDPGIITIARWGLGEGP